jgi:hypothetical protein
MGDTWSEIYGGITNDTELVVHMTISVPKGPAVDNFYQ